MLRDNLLTVQSEVTGGVVLLRLEGELIAESRYEPERVLREWLEADVPRAIVDCERIVHIDSAGFSTLLGALHRYRRHEGDLVLARLNPSLAAMFEATSMGHYFKIFADVEAARRHFQSPPGEADAARGPRPAEPKPKHRARKDD